MRDQLERVPQGLRFATIEELLAHRGDLPNRSLWKWLAKNPAGGKTGPWVPLFELDKKGKVTVRPSIKK